MYVLIYLEVPDLPEVFLDMVNDTALVSRKSIQISPSFGLKTIHYLSGFAELRKFE